MPSAIRILVRTLNLGSAIKLRNSLSGASRDGYWDQYYWESTYPDILADQEYKAGNPGQETILSGDWLYSADFYCRLYGESFTTEDFLARLRLDLGDDKYNAVSIISEECAEELLLAWDDAYAGDSIGPALFRTNAGITHSAFSRGMRI